MAGTPRTQTCCTDTRAVTPVVGVLALIVVTFTLAALASTLVVGLADTGGLDRTVDRTLSTSPTPTTTETPTATPTPEPTCDVTHTDGQTVVRNPRPSQVAADTVELRCSFDAGTVTVGDATTRLEGGTATVTRDDAPTDAFDADGRTVTVTTDGETVFETAL